jgi:hypothetical protein
MQSIPYKQVEYTGPSSKRERKEWTRQEDGICLDFLSEGNNMEGVFLKGSRGLPYKAALTDLLISKGFPREQHKVESRLRRLRREHARVRDKYFANVDPNAVQFDDGLVRRITREFHMYFQWDKIASRVPPPAESKRSTHVRAPPLMILDQTMKVAKRHPSNRVTPRTADPDPAIDPNIDASSNERALMSDGAGSSEMDDDDDGSSQVMAGNTAVQSFVPTFAMSGINAQSEVQSQSHGKQVAMEWSMEALLQTERDRFEMEKEYYDRMVSIQENILTIQKERLELDRRRAEQQQQRDERHERMFQELAKRVQSGDLKLSALDLAHTELS